MISITTPDVSGEPGELHEGHTVDVHVLPQLLEVWDGNELIRTAARTSKGDIRKKRAAAR